MNDRETVSSIEVPMFDDDEVIRLAVEETHLPEEKVRAVVEAQAWFLICAGVMGVKGGDTETKVAEYLARFPHLLEARNEEHPTLYDADEATFITETTGIFEDETTRVLVSVRAYEEALGIVPSGSADAYRAWRIAWLTHIVRPRILRENGKLVVYSFVEALAKESAQARPPETAGRGRR